MTEENKSGYGVMLDFAQQHGGFERPPEGLATTKCPRCGAETMGGFGLFGGSYGSYVMCIASSEACGWYYKKPEEVDNR